MNKTSVAAAAAALAFSVGASAQTAPVFDLTSGAFANAYSFTLAAPGSVHGDTNSAGVSWFGALLRNTALSYTQLDTNPDDGFSFSGLPADTYVLTFLGSGTGGYGGYFTDTADAPVAVFDLASGAFANAYTFTSTAPSSVRGETKSANVSWFGALLRNTALSYTQLDPNPDDGFSFSGLPADTYVLTFLGSGRGGYGGYYTETADVPAPPPTPTTPIPEPSTYALLLAGLGLVGGFAPRRRA